MLTGSTAGDINDNASIIWFTSSDDDSKKAVETLNPIAENYISKFKKGEVEEVKFFVHNADKDEDDIGESLKSFANISDKVELCMLNIPQQEVGQ